MIALLLEKNINWEEYPSFFKRGSFFKKELIQKTEIFFDKSKNEDKEISFVRNVVQEIELQPLNSIDIDETINLLFK
jgi:hypothetical protein